MGGPVLTPVLRESVRGKPCCQGLVAKQATAPIFNALVGASKNKGYTLSAALETIIDDAEECFVVPFRAIVLLSR